MRMRTLSLTPQIRMGKFRLLSIVLVLSAAYVSNSKSQVL
jgi:hypothetical protein